MGRCYAMRMADVCDDDGVSGESLRKRGTARFLSFFFAQKKQRQINTCSPIEIFQLPNQLINYYNLKRKVFITEISSTWPASY